MFLQKTIRSRIQVEGIGLHTGAPCRLNFSPAPANTGIHFIRNDLPGRPSVKVFVENVSATSYATTLRGPGFEVATIEHCLSVMAAFRIDNLNIELDGPEIPIVDGSAEAFMRAILQSGFVEQEAPRLYLKVVEPLYLSEGDKQAYLLPYAGLRLTVNIDFAHPKIGQQKIDLDVNEESFRKELACARTFGFLKDVQLLQSRGLARGGSLANAIVLDDQDILNPEGLRWPNEFVRHKAMDALGDLVTLGSPLLGHVVLQKAGHDLLNKLVKKMLASTDHFKKVDLGDSGPL